MHIIGLQRERRNRKNRREKNLKIIAKSYNNIAKIINSQIQEVQWISSTRSMKKITPIPIIIKLLKISLKTVSLKQLKKKKEQSLELQKTSYKKQCKPEDSGATF